MLPPFARMPVLQDECTALNKSGRRVAEGTGKTPTSLCAALTSKAIMLHALNCCRTFVGNRLHPVENCVFVCCVLPDTVAAWVWTNGACAASGGLRPILHPTFSSNLGAVTLPPPLSSDFHVCRCAAAGRACAVLLLLLI